MDLCDVKRNKNGYAALSLDGIFVFNSLAFWFYYP